MAILKIENLSKSFGGLRALDEVSINVEKGELRGIIGPNGSGKTTLFNVLNGLYKPTAGNIYLGGTNIAGFPLHRVLNHGIARTFQEIQLFYDLTVLDNVMLGGHKHARANVLTSIFAHKKTKIYENVLKEKAMDCLSFVGLEQYAAELARNLPYGHQRLLEIARAIASEPDIILLDEPAAGMNDQEKVNLTSLIEELNTKVGVTILLVEHNMKLVMALCKKISVLNHGRKIAEGSATDIQCNEVVIEAYLGSSKECV